MSAKPSRSPLSEPAVRRLLAIALPVDAWFLWNAISGEWSWLPAAFAVVVTVAALAELWPGGQGGDPVSLDDGAMRPPAPRTGERLLWRGIRAARLNNAAGVRPLRGVRAAPLTVRNQGAVRREGQPVDAD